MSIRYDHFNRTFKIDTKESSYVFCISEGDIIEHLYYGKKIYDSDLAYLSHRQGYSFAFAEDNVDCKFSLSTVFTEYPSLNAGDFRDGAFCIENADGTIGNRLCYKRHSIYKQRKSIPGLPHSRINENCESLELVLTDEEKSIEVVLYYVVYADEDVIARYQKIKNKSKGTAYVLRASSTCVDFCDSDFDLIELRGIYAYERASIQRVPLKKGFQSIASTLGTTSHHTNPFFALVGKGATEDLGEAYGFNLVYSGSFFNQIEVDRLGSTRVISGINPTGFRWELKTGESFYTPEAIMTYSDAGIGGMSRNFHDHIRANIIEPNFVYTSRPIVVNTWEGSHFDVTENSVLALADEALKVGADTVVLDDGWFRDGEKTGLGDWLLDKEKFPNGLSGLADKIHEKFLRFGIWIEPEMAAKESRFAIENPDKILRTREMPVTGRHQYVMDLTSDEVVDYVFDTVTSALDGVAVDFIKWDANRYITEAGSKSCTAGEVYHKQILGVYKLFEKFKNKFPSVLLESCSGGGGRFDLGMLYYSPQIWTSDNTDPYGRVYIQYGTSVAYPTSSISCHYTMGHGYSGRESTPEFRYLVAAFGPYGYELDLTLLPDEEKTELKKLSDRHKEIEEFNLSCDLYRLISPETDRFCAYMQVSKDKKQALFTLLELHATPYTQSMVIKLKGLDENIVYKNTSTGEKKTGTTWMYAGIRINDLWAKSGSGQQILFRAVDEA